MRAEDGSVVAAKPSLTDSGVLGPVTRVYPDDEAAVGGTARGHRGGCTCCFAVLGTDLGTKRGATAAMG